MKALLASLLLVVGIQNKVPPFPGGLLDQGALSSTIETGMASGSSNTQEKYQAGVVYQDLGLLSEAEMAFLEVVSVDPNDWEAHEHFAQLYESQGRMEERDREIEMLRLLVRSGLAWRNYYCRDVFRLGNRKVRAMEFPPLDPDGRKTVLFLVSGGRLGGSPLLISVTRSEKS
jgi:tetratricopeptide (TPR) repeat protein